MDEVDFAQPKTPEVKLPQRNPFDPPQRVKNLKNDHHKGNNCTQLNRSTSLFSRSMEWANSGKGRFLFGPTPFQQLGPKATISENHDADYFGMIDPSVQRLEWHSPPKNVLIIKKHHDQAVTDHFKTLTKWLIQEKEMTIFVEENVIQNSMELDDDFANDFLEQLKPLKESEKKAVDLVVCLGGDGTLIHVCSLFQSACPPVIAFHMGSLGFLTPFSMKNFSNDINSVIDANVGLTLRNRLKCQVRQMHENGKDEVLSEYLVLNEVVVDRGTSSSVTHVEIHCNGRYLTTLLGDGLIISTPTGSTAYSMSAGASMVHPSVPGIVVTPICAHSLSFRPIVLPAGVELKIIVSSESRNSSPMCSFDGRYPSCMNRTKYLRVTTSVYPIPCISHQDHLSDWFNSLAECLHWNKRELKRTTSYTPSPAKGAVNSTKMQLI